MPETQPRWRTDPRCTNQYRQLSRAFWAAHETNLPHLPTCALCGNPVDISIRGNTPESRSIEHPNPVRTGADPYRITEWQVAHYGCNSRQGGRTHGQDPQLNHHGEHGQSRDW